MDNSASTSERLQVDLDRRKLELQKIQMLDQKIELELKVSPHHHLLLVLPPHPACSAPPHVHPTCRGPTHSHRLLASQEKREKMVSMEREVEEFKDLKKLKADAQRQSEELRMKKEAAQGRKQGLKEEAKKHRAKYEEIKASLASDELAKKIDELEQRVKHQESTVYALSDYIETKGAESHFEPIAEDCTLKCKALNTETIRVLAEAPVFAGGFY